MKYQKGRKAKVEAGTVFGVSGDPRKPKSGMPAKRGPLSAGKNPMKEMKGTSPMAGMKRGGLTLPR